MPFPFVDHSDSVRYPIGDFGIDPEVTPAKRRQWIRQMAELPATLGAAVSGLSDAQRGTANREGGWTLRQVVHHLADAPLNDVALARFLAAEVDARHPLRSPRTRERRAPAARSVRTPSPPCFE